MRSFIPQVWLGTLVLLSLATGSWAADASRVVLPDAIEGSVNVDAEEVIELVATVPHITIIDSRIATDRVQGYIEGSVSLPDEMTTCNALDEVAKSKDLPVLFYCNGPKCGRSAMSVRIAIHCGYSRVYWFRGGFEEWKQKRYPYIKE